MTNNYLELPKVHRLTGVRFTNEVLEVSLTDDCDTNLVLKMDVEALLLLGYYLAEAGNARSWRPKHSQHGQILQSTFDTPPIVKMGGVYLGADEEIVEVGFLSESDLYLNLKLPTDTAKELLCQLQSLARRYSWAINPNGRCFYADGTARCRVLRVGLSNFCAQHAREFSDMDNLSLLREAASSMRQSMYVNSEKKLSLTADGGHYHRFSNCLNALIGRGYSQDEVIKAIGYIAGQEGVWDEIHAKMGKAVNKEPPWKTFEKLSLGVHLLRQEGALIEHNEKITGIRTGRPRQIDISVRFKHGYYDYLSVVECKDTTVTIEHVEAFRTKIEDVGAQKGVMI
ncbi:MAG TPA: hypothetical protein VF179_07560, partial [Thermoanaerobaculia bacterium]|nr:hypothetical protein [Thermoanaerobaculia bacterium]